MSRQTIYAIEAGDYVPNTALALQLSKILEVRVEDLFQLQGDIAVPPPPITVELLGGAGTARKGQPVQLCPVGKRLTSRTGEVPFSHRRMSLKKGDREG